MKELVLDGAVWITKDDPYDAFFRAVGVPGGIAGISMPSATAFRLAQPMRWKFRTGW
jgi:hypothetical protein